MMFEDATREERLLAAIDLLREKISRSAPPLTDNALRDRIDERLTAFGQRFLTAPEDVAAERDALISLITSRFEVSTIGIATATQTFVDHEGSQLRGKYDDYYGRNRAWFREAMRAALASIGLRCEGGKK